MSSPHSAEEFRDAIAHMRRTCPPPKGFGVQYKRVDASSLGGSHASCEKTKNKFTIKISKDLTLQEMYDSLIHEQAHMYDWSANNISVANTPHGPTWGVFYALVYQKFNETL